MEGENVIPSLLPLNCSAFIYSNSSMFSCKANRSGLIDNCKNIPSSIQVILNFGGEKNLLEEDLQIDFPMWYSIFFSLKASKEEIISSKINKISILDSQSNVLNQLYSIKKVLATENYQMNSVAIAQFVAENVYKIQEWMGDEKFLRVKIFVSDKFQLLRVKMVYTSVFHDRLKILTHYPMGFGSSLPFFERGNIEFKFDEHGDSQDKFSVVNPSLFTQISTYFPIGYGIVRLMEIKNNVDILTDYKSFQIEAKFDTTLYIFSYLIFNMAGRISFKIPKNENLNIIFEMKKDLNETVFFFQGMVANDQIFSLFYRGDTKEFLSLDIRFTGIGLFNLQYKDEEMMDYEDIPLENIFYTYNYESVNFTSYCTNYYTDFKTKSCLPSCPSFTFQPLKICQDECSGLETLGTTCICPDNKPFYALSEKGKIVCYSECPKVFYGSECLDTCNPDHFYVYNKKECVKDCSQHSLYRVEKTVDCRSDCPTSAPFFLKADLICRAKCPDSTVDSCQSFLQSKNDDEEQMKLIIILVTVIPMFLLLFILSVLLHRHHKKKKIQLLSELRMPPEQIHRTIIPTNNIILTKNITDQIPFMRNQSNDNDFNPTKIIEIEEEEDVDLNRIPINIIEKKSEKNLIDEWKAKNLFNELKDCETSQLSRFQLRKIKFLGKGGEGQIYMVENEFGEKFAYKCYAENIKEIDVESKEVITLEHELEFLEDLKNPLILYLRGVVYEKKELNLISFGIIVDLMDFDLRAFIKMDHVQKFGLKVKIKICLEIVNALIFIHDKNVAHNDLKPDNILLKGRDNSRNSFDVRISDFGSALRLDNPNRKYRIRGITILYASPEYILSCFNEEENSSMVSLKNDIWSLGLILYEFFFGDFQKKISFLSKIKGEAEDMIKIKSEIELEKLKPEKNFFFKSGENNILNEKIINIINSCVQMSQDKRPTAYEIRRMFNDLYSDFQK